jgi:hypothetical protein
VPGRVLFKEDFFERVLDVQWESEPTVYWMAATGFPYIVNSMVAGDNRAWIFTSEDGIHWTGQDMSFKPGEWGFSAFYGGGWMRENLQAGDLPTKQPGKPVWVLVGSDGRIMSGSASAASTDGKSISRRNYHDDRHHGDKFAVHKPPRPPTLDNPQGSPGEVKFNSMFNFPDWHTDTFTSSNGQTWNPAKYHSGSRLLVPRSLSAAAASEISPLIETEQAEAVGAKKTFNQGNSLTATGRVKKGPYAGRTVKLTLSNYNYEFGYGPGTIDIVEKTRLGDKPLDTVNCNVARSITIAYGHYIFCVGGSSRSVPAPGGSDYLLQMSTIAYTDNLVDWKAIDLGLHSQVNVLAVGPRK